MAGFDVGDPRGGGAIARFAAYAPRQRARPEAGTLPSERRRQFAGGPCFDLATRGEDWTLLGLGRSRPARE
jgi:hypothetical protein